MPANENMNFYRHYTGSEKKKKAVIAIIMGDFNAKVGKYFRRLRN